MLVAAEWLAFLLRIRKISASNLGTQTGNFTEVLVMVSSHAKAGMVPQIRPRPSPSTSNPIHYSFHPTGARGGAVGSGTALQTGRSRVRFPIVSLEFFIEITLPAAPWGWLSL